MQRARCLPRLEDCFVNRAQCAFASFIRVIKMNRSFCGLLQSAPARVCCLHEGASGSREIIKIKSAEGGAISGKGCHTQLERKTDVTSVANYGRNLSPDGVLFFFIFFVFFLISFLTFDLELYKCTGIEDIQIETVEAVIK